MNEVETEDHQRYSCGHWHTRAEVAAVERNRASSMTFTKACHKVVGYHVFYSKPESSVWPYCYHCGLSIETNEHHVDSWRKGWATGLYDAPETCHNGSEDKAKGSESMLGDKTNRVANARRLLGRGRVNVAVADNLWVVQGDTGNYIVKKKSLGPFVAECQCEDFKFNTAEHNGYCKHIMAVALSESYHNGPSLESLSSAKGAKLSIGVYVRPTGSVLHQTFELEKTSTLASNAVYVDVELTNGISKRIKIKVNGEGKITVEDEKFI